MMVLFWHIIAIDYASDTRTDQTFQKFADEAIKIRKELYELD